MISFAESTLLEDTRDILRRLHYSIHPKKIS